MGGGLLQLVAYGAQDVYLTGNPQITFFKVVYRRHTNFAIESIRQVFNGQAEYGNTITCQISRNGDLINRCYVELDIPGLGYDIISSSEQPKYVDYLGLKILKSVVCEIGGQQVDKHYSDWMYIWNELSLPIGKRFGYDKMVGANGDYLSKLKTDKKTKLSIPLEFWFCRNVGLALPLIALQYHEVKINIHFEEYSLCQRVSNSSSTVSDLQASLWVDYIYLDTDERRKFAQSSHEYLIEQLQFTGKENADPKIRLNLNHPVKELIWVVKKENTNNTNWFNYTDKNTQIVSIDNYESLKTLIGPNSATNNNISSGKLILNGNDRFSQRDGLYFNLIQPYQHHENIPYNTGINVYSFALKPEEHQPSGTLNMSRIDTSTLSLKYSSGITESTASIYVYAVNYNVLRILSGMGGIAYSN